MNAVCPNDVDHKRFVTVAHITQDWEVDENGDFIRVVADGEVVAKPDAGNTWTCVACGEEAEVSNE